MSFVSRIVGMGMHLPGAEVTNEELAPRLGVTPEWIETRSGVRTRFFGTAEQSTSDLGLEAAKAALEDAKLSPEQIDLILFATLTPDHEFPGSGFFLQTKLKTRHVPVFDLRAMCSGFLYGLSIADKFLASGEHEHVLVVGAEMHSKGMDFRPEGKHVTALFGDGAGAFVLRREEASPGAKKPLQAFELHADGKFAKALWVKASGTGTGEAQFMTREQVEKGEQWPEMDGPTVFLTAIKRMTEVIASVLKKEGLAAQDVDLFVVHQANLRIIERVAQNLGVPMERFHNTISRTANTTAASLPIGFCDARAAGRLGPGTRVVTATFGSGFSWGAAVLNF